MFSIPKTRRLSVFNNPHSVYDFPARYAGSERGHGIALIDVGKHELRFRNERIAQAAQDNSGTVWRLLRLAVPGLRLASDSKSLGVRSSPKHLGLSRCMRTPDQPCLPLQSSVETPRARPAVLDALGVVSTRDVPTSVAICPSLPKTEIPDGQLERSLLAGQLDSYSRTFEMPRCHQNDTPVTTDDTSKERT